MSNLYRVQATIWVDAESEKHAADLVFDELSSLVNLDNLLCGAEVEEDGELAEETA